jgi:hypothetical protein
VASACCALERLVSPDEPVGNGCDSRLELLLGSVRVEVHLGHAIDLELVVVARRIELRAQVIDLVGVGRGFQLGGLVVGLERLQDLNRIVDEVENVGGVLARVGAVQARERLHGLDAAQQLVDVHAAEQGLVEAGLELVGDQ